MRLRVPLIILSLAVMPASVLQAQSALVIFAHGGHHAPLQSLSPTDDLAARFGFGGGLALQVSRNVAFRGSATIVRTEYRGTTTAVTDSGLSRASVMGDLQIGWPSTGSLIPYVLLGGGAVIATFDEPAQGTSTFPAARVGTGINYVSGIGAFFTEAHVTAYRWSALGLERFQMDLSVHVGIAFAVRLGG